MPEIAAVATSMDPEHRVAHVVWTPLANSDTGSPAPFQPGADRSVQVRGTFGAGGTVIIQGSNDLLAAGATWATLTDPQGNALSFTAAGLEQVSEFTRWIRPNVTGGDGTTALTVTMLAGRSR